MTKVNALQKLGTYLFALPMAVFGILHFMAGEAMAGTVPIPGGVIWVYLTGLALITAAVAISFGKKAVLAAQLLAVFLLLTALTIHLPSLMGGDQNAMAQVLKDIALAGGALVLSGVLAGAGTGTPRA